MKTDFLIIGTRQQLLKGQTAVSPVASACNLGIWFDTHLDMRTCITRLVAALSTIYTICHIRKYLSREDIYKILLITFKILHGLSPKHLSDLISIQQPSSYHLRRNDNGHLLERPRVKTLE